MDYLVQLQHAHSLQSQVTQEQLLDLQLPQLQLGHLQLLQVQFPFMMVLIFSYWLD